MIDRLIGDIKKRPRMFIEKEQLDLLHAFLDGYLGAYSEYQKVGHNFSDLNYAFSAAFHKWVPEYIQKHIDPNCVWESFHWYHTIRKVTQTEEEALDLFYKICDAFFEDFHRRN